MAKPAKPTNSLTEISFYSLFGNGIDLRRKYKEILENEMRKSCFSILLLITNILLFSQIPELEWAVSFGGNHLDKGYDIAIDDLGNSYIIGSFNQTASFGSFTLTSNGADDIYIAKIDEFGNCIWVNEAGSSDWDSGFAISVGSCGDIYITGKFCDIATFGQYSLTSSGNDDVFVAKIDNNGNWLWVNKAGGNGFDCSQGITIDSEGNNYVIGYFHGSATFGSYTLMSSGNDDIFIAKIDSNGTWQWAIKAGGNDIDRAYGVSVYNNDFIYVTGIFNQTASFGLFTLTSNGAWDIFVVKIDSNGIWQWANKAGGNDMDSSTSITTDSCGNNYISGVFFGSSSFGSNYLTSSGNSDIYVSKIDSNGEWIWAEKAIGNEYAISYDNSIDYNGNCYITGFISDNTSFGSHSVNYFGYEDIFVAKIDQNGIWQWALSAGGSGSDRGWGIETDSNGNTFVIGNYRDTAFFGSHTLIGNGMVDVFVFKLTNDISCGNKIIPIDMEVSNHPNPFNPSTTISFNVTQNFDSATIEIYNLKGQKVKSFQNLPITQSSNHQIIWHGDDNFGKPVSSGIYFYKLKVDDKTEAVKKCLLLK